VRGLRHHVRSLFLKSLDEQALHALVDVSAATMSPETLIQLRVLGGAMARVTRDATAFAHRDKGLLLMVTNYGPGLEGATQGEPATFTIEARDRLGQRIKTGGDPFKVDVKGPYNRDVDVKQVDNNDGTHTVTYTPIDHGKHEIKITLEGKHVAKSPYVVNADKPKGYPDALKCYAEGPGLKGGNTAEPATFTIYAKDSNGNPVNLRENPFVVDIVNPDGSETEPQVVNNNDGTYGSPTNRARSAPTTSPSASRTPLPPSTLITSRTLRSRLPSRRVLTPPRPRFTALALRTASRTTCPLTSPLLLTTPTASR